MNFIASSNVYINAVSQVGSLYQHSWCHAVLILNLAALNFKKCIPVRCGPNKSRVGAARTGAACGAGPRAFRRVLRCRGHPVLNGNLGEAVFLKLFFVKWHDLIPFISRFELSWYLALEFLLSQAMRVRVPESTTRYWVVWAGRSRPLADAPRASRDRPLPPADS